MRYNRGASLIETLIYSAILAVLSVLAINTVLAMLSAFSQARALKQAGLSAETSLERLTREVRLASSIDEGASFFTASSSRLVLNTVKSAADPTPVSRQFFVSGSRMAVQEGSDPVEFLTSNKILISSFWAAKITTPNSQAVKVVLALETVPGKHQARQTFYQHVILRGRY